ncbi:MAG: hypothetical protein ACLP66_27170 [Polyangia bacterium]
MTNQQAALAVAERIVALRAELRQLESQFGKFVPDGAVSQANGHAVESAQTGGRNGTKSAALLAYMTEHADQAFGAKDLVKASGFSTPISVRSTLLRMIKSGQVVKAGKGLYRAATGTA